MKEATTGLAIDVGVIGCGTAGAAAAIALARRGHRVTVYEAVQDPGPVGAGITIQPTGMGALARLDLLGDVLAKGAPIDRLRCLTRSGRSVLDLRYADYHPHAFGLGLHRGVLFEVLFDAAREQERVTLRCGIAIEGMALEGGRRVLVGRDGSRHGPHELVVVADGARSQLRDDTQLTRRAKPYPWGALWFIGEDREGAFDRELFQRVDGTSRMLGLLPSGLGPRGDVPLVSLFWSIHVDEVERWRDRGLAPWREALEALEPGAAPLLAQIRDLSEVLFARYWDVVLSPWHAERVVYLGDAAHATSPQLGQGANLALVDALSLADALDGAETVQAALATYSRMRRHHLGYYQWATRFLTPLFQSDQAWLGWLRDAFMGAACRTPYVRTRMLRTMCGLDRGVLLADPLPLPAVPRQLQANVRPA